jgi:hypothetical protein
MENDDNDKTNEIEWCGDEYVWDADEPANSLSITGPTINWSSITSTVGQSYSSPITFIDDNEFDFIISEGKELIDHMPDISKINEMCSMYSSLDKAFENFKLIYKLVHDDYVERKNANDE